MRQSALHLLSTINCINESLKTLEGENFQISAGISKNLNDICTTLKCIRSKPGSRQIGIFGGQKRGKSTLINCLLGCGELLPVGNIPMSSVAIEIRHAENSGDNDYTMSIYNEDNRIQTLDALSLEDAKIQLKNYATREGAQSKSVKYIEIVGDFKHSKILKDGDSLIDTPGAEAAYMLSHESKEIQEDIHTQNIADTNRAIEVLTKANLALFVERADSVDNKETSFFYKEHLQNLNMLPILNFKDLVEDEFEDEEETYERMLDSYQRKMRQNFGMDSASLQMISCAQFEDATNEEEYQHSRIPQLEERILKEMDLLPANCFLSCLRRIHPNLKLISQNHKQLLLKASLRFANVVDILKHCTKENISDKQELDTIDKALKEALKLQQSFFTPSN